MGLIMDAPIEIRGLNKLRVDLILVYYFAGIFVGIITLFLSKEFLFFSHKDLLHDYMPSLAIFFAASILILAIRNEILLKPMCSFYRSKVKDYSLKTEIKDFLIRWTIGCVIPTIISLGCLYLVFYPSGIEATMEVLGDLGRIAVIQAIFFICGTAIFIVICKPLLWRIHTEEHDEEEYREWFETTLPSFPLKYALTSFILLLMALLLSFIYVYLYINPRIPQWVSGISLLSELIGFFPFYYYISKRILNRFIERYDAVLFPSQ